MLCYNGDEKEDGENIEQGTLGVTVGLVTGRRRQLRDPSDTQSGGGIFLAGEDFR